MSMTGVNTGETLLPFYIVCDESGSMGPNGGVDAINQGLPDLHATIAADPLVSDKCRIALITFSDTAEELMSLARATDINAMPGVQAKGITNYGAVFRLLRQVISRDIANLKSQGYIVYQPAVFFITDGEPTDTNWEPDYQQLVDKNLNAQYPHIISFGVAGADPMVVGKVGTVGAFVQDQHGNPATALKEILRSLTNSIVASSSSSSPQLVVPSAPDGSMAVPLQTM
jgi:uncharacterized protein YegL